MAAYASEVTVLGVLTFLGLGIAALDWERWYPWLLSTSLALPISAAVYIPGSGVTPFYVVAGVGLVPLTWQWLRHRTRPRRMVGGGVLLCFVLWCAAVTAVGPALFEGLTVVNQSDLNDGLPALIPLTYTTSNMAQLVYLVAAAGVIVFLATSRRLPLDLLLPAMVLTMTLSLWRLGHDKAGLPFPVSLVDSSDGRLIDTLDYRLRGVFTEPSGLAHYATATLAVCLIMLVFRTGKVRWLYALVAVEAVVNIVFSRSGTAVVGGTVVVLVVVVLVVVRIVRSGRSITPLVIGLCVVGIGFLLTQEAILGYLSEIFDEKYGSQSYDERTTSNLAALELLRDSYGIGVGLGSNKPSTLWAMLLSCTGVVGTALYAWFAGTTIWRALKSPVLLAAGVGALSLIITKCVAGQFLGEPLLVLALGMAACRGQLREPEPDQPAEPVTVPALTAR